MAAPKENLLSLGHLTGTERNTFTKQRERCEIKSVNKPMLLQADFSALQSQQHLKKMHLQQRWQELKEREHAAQQHNRQLLLQFEKAQDTLKGMLVRNAAMKTIRVEYERYLVESSPRWQQQLEEKTHAAQKKCLQQKMEACLRSYQKITEEERVKKSSADRPLLSQGVTIRPQKIGEPQVYSSQEYSNYNHDGFSHLPYTKSSSLTHTQSHTGRFPVRVPYQPHASSQVPPPFLPHPHPFPLPHLTSTPGHHHHHRHHHPWLRQDPLRWPSPQPDYSWSWAAGAAGIPSGPEALWGQVCMEEPSPESEVSQIVGEEDKTSRAPSSKAERGGGSRSSHLSQELDIKPVRLSSGLAESSESGRDSSLASRETRKRREKRGRTQRSSLDRERCSSRESSRTSSAVVIASAAVAQSSESDASSEKDCNSNSSRRRRRSGGLTVGSPRSEKIAKERTSSKGDDSESQHTGEELGSSSEESKSKTLGNQGHDGKSGSCKEESGSKREEESGSESIKIENEDADENDNEESSGSEETSTEEMNEEERKKILVAGEDDGDEENIQEDEEQQDRHVEGDDEEVCARKDTTEEEEEMAAEEEMEDQGDDEEQSNSLKKNNSENRKEGSASSQDEEEDEDGSEGGENKIEEGKEGSDEEEDEDGSEGSEDRVGEDEEGSNKEEDGESEEEEKHRSDEEGRPEDRDSDDSIISPQEKRPIRVQVIPEEAAEDDEGDEEEEGGEKSKTGSCNDDSNEFSDEDIEDLLAPQEQTKEEKDLKTEEKPKALSDSMKIFQVEQDTSKTHHPIKAASSIGRVLASRWTATETVSHPMLDRDRDRQSSPFNRRRL